VSRLDKQNHEWEGVVNSSIMEEGNNGLKQRLGRVAAHMATERLIYEISQVIVHDTEEINSNIFHRLLLIGT